jgi:hypothetical protein
MTKQEEINFEIKKEEPPKILQGVIFKVPKDFSPENIKRILTPLKMKVQYWQTILMNEAIKIALVHQGIILRNTA